MRFEQPTLTKYLLTFGLSALMMMAPQGTSHFSSPAQAQDGDGDDGGGGDDGGDDGGGGGGSGGSGGGASSGGGGGNFEKGRDSRKLKRKVKKKKAAPARKTVREVARKKTVLATREPDQIVALGLNADELTTLTTRGYVVIERFFVSSISTEMIKLKIPAKTNLDDARNEVRTINAAAVADFNHFYRPGQAENQAEACSGLHCKFEQMIVWPASAGVAEGCSFGQGVVGQRIGMIDTAVNTGHDALKASRIELLQEIPEGKNKSGTEHGTAVAALLVGAPGSRTPGLLAGSSLLAIDPFHTTSGDQRGDVYSIVKAFDRMLAGNVTVINMSFAGPDNTLLGKLVEIGDQKKIALVAAAGNDGPRSEPRFPAAYSQVIAVTAVDTGKRVFRRAVQGEHIDFAAPGVNVWTAAPVKGGKTKTGTSFAAPFVTAAAALAKAKHPEYGTAEIANLLASGSLDLGESGKDKVFGHGLVQAGVLCGG
ncbi:MAG: S8 family serine peptidase [Rhizobiaceae bacterium]